jgi:hypothetical protein
LATPITEASHVIYENKTTAEHPTTDCPGIATEPAAAVGFLCVFESKESLAAHFVKIENAQGTANQTSRTGAFVIFESEAETAELMSLGTWALTAS